MVITASASLQASSDDAARTQPWSTARSSASALRSKARTSCPALARFGAIPPPMWPRPMKAILAIARELLPAGPVAGALLDEGGHSFFLVVRAEQSVEQAALEADALRQRHLERRVDHLLGRDRGERGHRRDCRGGF